MAKLAKTRQKRHGGGYGARWVATTPRTRHRAVYGAGKVSLAAYFPGLPVPVAEYAFAAPQRKFRFDLCWPELKIGLEQDGSVWANGRHNRGAGFVKDMEKMNLAGLLGYRVFRFTPQQVRSLEACAFMHRVMEGK